MSQGIDLRAHHLLCILGFRGLGYSEGFIQNMSEVVRSLRLNRSPLIVKVIDRCDIICSACPHNKGNECHKEDDSEQRVKSQDLNVAQRLSLEIGDEVSSQELWAMVKERLSPEDLLQICHGCEWLGLGYCIEGLRGLDRANGD
jgi:hypothetical protein